MNRDFVFKIATVLMFISFLLTVGWLFTTTVDNTNEFDQTVTDLRK